MNAVVNRQHSTQVSHDLVLLKQHHLVVLIRDSFVLDALDHDSVEGKSKRSRSEIHELLRILQTLHETTASRQKLCDRLTCQLRLFLKISDQIWNHARFIVNDCLVNGAKLPNSNTFRDRK